MGVSVGVSRGDRTSEENEAVNTPVPVLVLMVETRNLKLGFTNQIFSSAEARS